MSNTNHETIAILDFGSQYGQLIARRLASIMLTPKFVEQIQRRRNYRSYK